MPRPSSVFPSADIQTQELPLTHRCRIPEEYRDAMGHMNVMWYTRLFSEASLEFMRIIGMDFKQLVAEGAGSFILESHVRHLAEIQIGQAIRIYSRLLDVSDSRIHLINFLMVEEGHLLAATGEYVHAHIDMATRRMAPIPESIRSSVAQVREEHSRLAWNAPVCGVMGARR